MGGTEPGLHLAVGRGTGILVIDSDEDRSAEGLTLKDARKNPAFVLFLARGDDVALPRTAAVELNLDLFGGDGKAWRTAIDVTADAAAMGFAPCGDSKKGAVNARHKESTYPEAPD